MQGRFRPMRTPSKPIKTLRKLKKKIDENERHKC